MTTDNHTGTAHSVPMYPALALMEKQFQPLRYGYEPFWRAPVVPAAKRFYGPSWNWQSIHEPPDGQHPLTLDVNGAYLGALGSVVIAHGPLTRQGEWNYLPEPRMVPPGYYEITVPNWSFSGSIVSPLGDSDRLNGARTLWVAHPTLVLLLELLDEGSIGEFGIIDSYTCAATSQFRAWVERLKTVRNACLDALEAEHHGNTPADCSCLPCSRYGAFKEGYSAALSMMLTGEKCKARRPDWAHAVYAQHAATCWRKAWRYIATGRVLLGMGAVDEITILAQDLPTVLAAPKPPIKCDRTGRTLGAFKIKDKPTPRPETRPAALAPEVTAPDEMDIV